MATWFSSAKDIPYPGVDIWIRVYWWFGQPVLAKYSDLTQQVTTNDGALVIPIWAISRWRYPDGYTPPTTTGFQFIVDTTKAGSAANTFVLPLTGSGYDFVIAWGDGVTGSYSGTPGNLTHVYAAGGVYTITINGDFPRIYFNNTGDKLKITSIEWWGLTEWISMQNAFYGCSNLVCNAIDCPRTGIVTNFAKMFLNCVKLVTVNFSELDTGNVTDFRELFNNCVLLEVVDVSKWDVSNVIYFQAMFYYCRVLAVVDVLMWNTANGVNFFGMFFNMDLLKELNVSNWNVSAGTNFADFLGYSDIVEKLLGVENWNTVAVTNFPGFAAYTTIKGNFGNLNIEAVTNMADMFTSCNINETGTSTNYDMTLVGWALQNVPASLSVNFGSSKYSDLGEAARDILTGAPNNWTITDGGHI